VVKRENWIDTLTLDGKSLQIGGSQPPLPNKDDGAGQETVQAPKGNLILRQTARHT
jgi:hypothetical protein